MKVLSCETKPMEWKTEDDIHVLQRSVAFNVFCSNGVLSVQLDKHFKTDGASVPFIFRWVRKSWYGDERDFGAIVHDALYTLAGKAEGLLMTREDCDDILRGIDRCTKATNRTKAGLVDKAVEFFANGKKHWGNDCFKQRDKIHIKFKG